jgi:hypothetical protein
MIFLIIIFIYYFFLDKTQMIHLNASFECFINIVKEIIL